MRQLPALFSTEMVKALLENRKTMTRRTKGLEKVNIDPDIWEVMPHDGKFIFDCQTYSDIKPITCKPNYMVGDQIWVKEEHYANGYWTTDGITKTGKPKLIFHDATIEELGEKYQYHDNIPSILENDRRKLHVFGWWKRNSLFMPKKAARIWLECTGVRCERLQDITEADAIDEGVLNFNNDPQKWVDYCPKNHYSKEELEDGYPFENLPSYSFATLWESINGIESVRLNPWVFVYSLNKLDQSPQSLTSPDKKP